MSTTEETPKFNKSEFIRAHSSMKPAEIIAEAEKLGHTISPGAIWTLRSSDKRKAEGKVAKRVKAGSGDDKKAAKKVAKRAAKAAKKVAKRAAKKAPEKVAKKFNKSAFIRKYPELGAAEIVKKAAALGHKITVGMIYTLRSSDKRAAKKVAKRSTKRAAKVAKRSTKKVSRKVTKKVSRMVVTRPMDVDPPKGAPITGRTSISFDPSDPAARSFIASALEANT